MLDLDALAPERMRLLRRTEYDRMVALGFFEDERLELLRGVLVEMTPQGTRHAEIIRRLTELLVLALHGRANVGPQVPFAVGDHSEPEPDLAVVPRRDYLDEHPTEAFLVIEVAATSLRKDRRVKADLYAEAGVPEYWIVNLVDSAIEVYTAPADGRYARREVFRHGDDITLAAFPDVGVPADAVLPPAETDDASQAVGERG